MRQFSITRLKTSSVGQKPSSFPGRRFLFYIATFCLLAILQSCAPESESIGGSFEITNEKEGKASALKNSDDVGYNICLEWMWGLNGVGTGPLHTNSTNRMTRGAGVPDLSLYVNENTEAALPVSADPGRFLVGGTFQFVKKGSKFGSSKTSLNYLEAVGDILYKYQLPDKSAFYGGLGPYIGYGIGGSVKSGGTKVGAFGGTDGYKRFDAGLHLTAGYQMTSSLQFSLGYEYGLVDKAPGGQDFSSKNRAFSVNVGYSIHKIVDAVTGKK